MSNQSLTNATEEIASVSVGAENIYPALVECFGIISLGYLAGRFKLLSTKEAKGIEIFVGTFALPAMIFTALCTLNLSSVNWKFVLSIFITKTIIFLAVVVVTLLVNHGHNVGKAGLYSIFVTQSNDFALGYPILNALYRQSYPEYPSYLYLLSPISLAILNPIGCILMEVDKVKSSNDTLKLEEEGNSSSSVNSTPQHTRKECEQNGRVKMDEHQIDVASKIKTNIDTNNKDYKHKWQRYRKGTIHTNNVEDSSVKQLNSEIWCPKKAKTVGKIVLGVFSNPIIILTFAGLIFGQFVFHGQMPPVINNFLQTLKNAYSATALFALGLGMVGKMEALKNGSKLLGPFILIVTKIILMPLVAREITNLLSAGSNEEETSRLADFAFLYGTFPTAPTVYVLATRYGIASSIIATTMIACTFLSAPIMFLSAQLSAAAKKPFDYHTLLEDSSYEICIISLVAIIWTIFIMLYTSKRWKYMPHAQTLLLLMAQGTACFGSILYYHLDFSSSWTQYVQFTLLLTGVYASRINSAIIALNLLLLSKGKSKLVSKLQPYSLILGICLPIFFVGILFALSPNIKHFNENKSINFKFGESQAILSLSVLTISFLIIMLFMILSQRGYKKKKMSVLSKSSVLSSNSTHTSTENAVDSTTISEVRQKYSDEILRSVGLCPEDNDLGDNEECCNWKNTKEKKKHERDCQMLRHTVLLIYIAISMVVGIALCSTRILYEDTAEVGIYFIVVFLDTSLNYGQGLMTCAVFGLESKYVFSPLLKWFKKIRNIYRKIKKGEQTGCSETKSYSLTILERVLRTFIGNRKKEIL